MRVNIEIYDDALAAAEFKYKAFTLPTDSKLIGVSIVQVAGGRPLAALS